MLTIALVKDSFTLNTVDLCHTRAILESDIHQLLRYVGGVTATVNIEVFANNPDSGELALNELPHMKLTLFAFQLSKYSKILIT